MIFTHGDADHSNGFAELAARVDIGAVLMPPARYCTGSNWESILATAETYGIQTIHIEQTAEVEVERATLRLMPPVDVDTDSGRCVGVLCTSGTFDVLITGDMDQADELALMRREQLPDIEVLVVGHHGSHYATSELLLMALQPETAIISVGYNSYGHPSEKTLALLEQYCAVICRTDRDGTVTVSA